MAEFMPTRALKIPSMFWKPRPKRETPDLFMSLPAELRNHIYDLILPKNDTICLYNREPSLLRTSKFIRQEARPVLYGNNTFVIQHVLGERQFAHSINRVASIVEQCGPQPFLSFRIVYATSRAKKYIASLLPLLEIMRKTGFEPVRGYEPLGNTLLLPGRTRSIESAMPIFDAVWLPKSVVTVFARAIALGRRARAEGWTKSRLESRFADFVKLAQKRTTKWPAWL